MNPDLAIQLKPWVSYINSWTLFSKVLIIKDVLIKNKKIILILQNEKIYSQYKKHLEYLHIPFRKINTQADLVDIDHDRSWLFIVDNTYTKEEIINPQQLLHHSLILKLKKEYELNALLQKLTELGYTHSDFQIAWSYKRTGDILHITHFSEQKRYSISFWGEYIESIIETDLTHINKTTTDLSTLVLWSNKKLFTSEEKNGQTLLNIIWESTDHVILDQLDFSENYYEYKKICSQISSLDYIWNKEFSTIIDMWIVPPTINSIENFKDIIANKGNHVYIYTKNTTTITNFLKYNNLQAAWIHEQKGSFIKSFQTTNSDQQLYIISDDVLWELFIKKRNQKNISVELDLLLKIHPGDYVVHIDHWIWIFKWIIKKELPQTSWKKPLIKEYIEIAYKWEDKLFVPITEVWRVNKFVWWDNPKLTGLNTTEWQRKLKKVDESVEALAEELLEVYSQRKLSKSFTFTSFPEQERKFQNSFPYQYTSDQQEVISDILTDMESSTPMDRLLVWDVGFWKTEVAFNAIYRALLHKKQVVFIAPLVVLAYEHYEKAVERFKEFWIKIWLLTRVESRSNTEKILTSLQDGNIDLIIWTHKLLQDTVIYKNLWLLVVDEEHKFGVKDKEKIKQLQSSIDILSMSATPIPRSLNMALSQIKQISIIKTPPPWRKSIRTFVSKYSEKVIYEWCLQEFEKWWQVYFVHNRIQNLVFFEKTLSELFPDKKIITTHGQLPWNTLEKRIIDFKNKKYDILLTTTVIENWIDFPNVNTIFVNEAQNFWISQVHQLRWRVWRSEKQWYCYLLYKNEKLGPETAKRLQTLVNYSYLWAWFELAIKDLEVRGWWDLLWIKQSWQSSEIWVNLYLRLIEQKIQELTIKKAQNQNTKDKKSIEKKETPAYINEHYTKIDLPIDISLPDDFFESDLDKINFYREIESINTIEDLKIVFEEFKNQYNIKSELHHMPQVLNLYNLLHVRIVSRNFFIIHIKKVWKHFQIDFNSKISLDILKKFLEQDKEVKFSVVTVNRVRSPIKYFTNEENFLEYLVNLLNKKIKNKKIRLKK